MNKAWIAAAILPLVAGCARRPVLYPNPKLDRAGAAAAERDIELCMRRGRQLVAGGRAEEVATETAVGAGVGAAAGAAGGAVVGRPGKGAAVGAASGGAASFLRSLFYRRDPEPAFRNFVERCLREKGYEPIGWR